MIKKWYLKIVYNLIEYNNNYSKTSGSFWQYYRNETALTNSDATANFHNADNSASFKVKPKITGVTGDNSTKMVPLKYLSNSWGTFEMP